MSGEMDSKTTTLWDDWKNCQAYHASIGLTSNLPKYVEFYEGKQWPAATENTKNLPRPVVNIIKIYAKKLSGAIKHNYVHYIQKIKAIIPIAKRLKINRIQLCKG